MRLLFDQNCSRRLVERLADIYPGSTHVALCGLDTSDDRTIWEAARRGEFVIVSKDTDFLPLADMYGHPPWLLWIRLGNCSTAAIEHELRKAHSELTAIIHEGVATIIAIG